MRPNKSSVSVCAGYSYAEIAKILLLDDETIRRHIEDYVREQKLKPENGGSVEHMTRAESEGLIRHLSEVTYRHVKDICHYVKRAYKKKYTVSGMTKWLHTHKFSYKKPHGVPAKANQEEQKKFIQYYEELKRKAGKKSLFILSIVFIRTTKRRLFTDGF